MRRGILKAIDCKKRFIFSGVVQLAVQMKRRREIPFKLHVGETCSRSLVGIVKRKLNEGPEKFD